MYFASIPVSLWQLIADGVEMMRSLTTFATAPIAMAIAFPALAGVLMLVRVVIRVMGPDREED